MTIVSLTDCCHLLAVDPKTLRRWMSLSGLSALPHPTDARLKCVTGEHLAQLAAAHHRSLASHVQPESSAPDSLTVASGPVLSDVPPNWPALIDSLTQQLGSLQAHVASLQHQLTRLSDQLQKEQEWRISQASITEKKSQGPSKEKSQESPQEKSQKRSLEKSQGSSREKSQESPQEKSQKRSLEKSQGSSREKSQEKNLARTVTNTPSVDRRKLPHVLPLVEYGAQDKYVVISPEQGLLDFEPDSPEWFAWLACHSSFRFMGKLGRFTAHRDSISVSRSWRASRQIRNRSYNLSLGQNASLTVSVLEQAAATLQSHLN